MNAFSSNSHFLSIVWTYQEKKKKKNECLVKLIWGVVVTSNVKC